MPAPEAVLKIINAYVAQEGKYPPAAYNCVGSGYTDWDNDGTLDCYSNGSQVFHPSATLNTELQKVAATPKVETAVVPGSGSTTALRGYVLTSPATVDSENRPILIYFLEGTNQDCVLPGELTYVGGTIGFTSNGARNQDPNFYGATSCSVVINQP